MLAIIGETAGQLRMPVRTIRHDVVSRCGPLGGMLTGLKTARAGAVLFLACDMPLVSPKLLKRLLRFSGEGTRAVVASQRARVGFPVLLPASTLAIVETQIQRRCLSIQELAAAVGARMLPVSNLSHELFNVNTPGDRTEAERLRPGQVRTGQ
jgi:molybdenum cofactor guanylyltransferase